MRTCLYILIGYLSGSILFANVFSALFHEKGAIEESKDKNPGTANAFLYGGFRCGVLTLICDLGKGILPVHFILRAAVRKKRRHFPWRWCWRHRSWGISAPRTTILKEERALP